nr:MAG TPA: hypothetical protein [Caudoviricetes sp.]
MQDHATRWFHTGSPTAQNHKKLYCRESRHYKIAKKCVVGTPDNAKLCNFTPPGFPATLICTKSCYREVRQQENCEKRSQKKTRDK